MSSLYFFFDLRRMVFPLGKLSSCLCQRLDDGSHSLTLADKEAAGPEAGGAAGVIPCGEAAWGPATFMPKAPAVDRSKNGDCIFPRL